MKKNIIKIFGCFMTKSIYYLILLILLMILNNNLTFATIIQGHILGFDENPIKISHIKIQSVDQNSDKPRFFLLIQADSNGFYRASVEDSLMYEIQVSGINHHTITFYLQPSYFHSLDYDTVFNIDIKLGTNIFDKQKQISIIYDFKKYNYYTMEYMPDNKYHYILNEPMDTCKYQLTNIMNNNHTTNGTAADTFLLDSYGDYYSVLYTKNKIPYEIVFDPKLLPNVNSECAFLSNNKKIVDYLNLQKQINDKMELLIDHNPLKSSNKKNENNEVGFKQFIDSLNEIMNFVKDEYFKKDLYYEKKILGVYYLYFNTFKFVYNNIKILGMRLYPCEIDDKFVKDILNVLSASDNEWKISAIDNGTLTASCYIAYKNLKNDYIDNLIYNTIDDDFKRREIVQIISFITEFDNDAKTLKYYKQIYTSKYPNDYYSTEYLKTLKGDGPLSVGKKLPSFKFQTLDGDFINTQSFSGYYTLIDVWATWCGPCVRELPYINEAFLKYSNNKLKIISISFDNDLNKVKNFQKAKIKMPWFNCIEKESFNSSFAKSLQINSIPELILLDPEQNIIALDDELRGNGLFKTLDKIFNK